MAENTVSLGRYSQKKMCKNYELKQSPPFESQIKNKRLDLNKTLAVTVVRSN